MPKNAAIFERSWFVCAALGTGVSVRCTPRSTCRRDRMSLMIAGQLGLLLDDLLERFLVDDVALDVGLRDHGRGARLARHQRHLAEELPVAQRRDLLRRAAARRSAPPPARRARRTANRPDRPGAGSPRPDRTRRGAAGAPADRSSRRRARGTRRRATSASTRRAYSSSRLRCTRSSFISVTLMFRDGNGISMPARCSAYQMALRTSLSSMSSRWTSSIQ